MKSTMLSRGVLRIVSVGLSASVLLAMVGVQPAGAATAPLATANALNVSGLLTLTTGACNAPTQPGDACGTPTASSNVHALLAAGVLTQTAGTTAKPADFACAGASGSGGSAIQVGPAGECGPINKGTGVVLLGGLVTADVLYATCEGTTTGVTHAFAPLTLASGPNTLLGGLLGAGTLSLVNVDATHLNLVLTPPLLGSLIGANPVTLLSITTNEVGTPDPTTGAQTFVALDVTVLGGLATVASVVPALATLLTTLGLTGLTVNSLVHLQVGVVTCSPITVPSSDVIPPAGAPIALGLLLFAGYLGRRMWWLPRKRAASFTA